MIWEILLFVAAGRIASGAFGGIAGIRMLEGNTIRNRLSALDEPPYLPNISTLEFACAGIGCQTTRDTMRAN